MTDPAHETTPSPSSPPSPSPGEWDEWDETRWAAEACGLREALRVLGLRMAYCLPGEFHACGGGADLHYASYLGLLRARVEMFWQNLDGRQLGLAVSAYRDEICDALRYASTDHTTAPDCANTADTADTAVTTVAWLAAKVVSS